MELTLKDRWLLSNQYRILALLDKKNAKDYDEVRQAIEYGYSLLYDEYSQYLYRGTDLISEEDCREVLDILDMFTVLNRAYKKRSEKLNFEEWQITFDGFDGNNETGQLGFALFYCKRDGGRYKELPRGDDFNSHSPELGRYRRQLRAWKSSKDKYELSTEDISRIAAEAIHPESRV